MVVLESVDRHIRRDINIFSQGESLPCIENGIVTNNAAFSHDETMWRPDFSIHMEHHFRSDRSTEKLVYPFPQMTRRDGSNLKKHIPLPTIPKYFLPYKIWPCHNFSQKPTLTMTKPLLVYHLKGEHEDDKNPLQVRQKGKQKKYNDNW